jgi:hypothetical protein
VRRGRPGQPNPDPEHRVAEPHLPIRAVVAPQGEHRREPEKARDVTEQKCEPLTVSQAAAPSGTITAVLVAAALAALLIVPAFVLLYVLDQKRLLPEEGVDEGPERTTGATQA